MISHKNLIANTSSIVEYLQLTPDDRMLVVLPFYYCYGLSLFHTHLQSWRIHCVQQSVYFPRRSAEEPAGLQMHWICRSSESFPDTSEEIRFLQANKIPDLRYVTQAGGKLAPIFIDEFREAHPEVRFVVMYGQTEATARLSWLPPEVYERRKGSMGKGIPGVELQGCKRNRESPSNQVRPER